MGSRITKSVYPGIDIGKFLCAFLILFYHYFSEHGSLPEMCIRDSLLLLRRGRRQGRGMAVAGDTGKLDG